MTAIEQIMIQLQYLLFSVDDHVDDVGERPASPLFQLRWFQFSLPLLRPGLGSLPQVLLIQILLTQYLLQLG